MAHGDRSVDVFVRKLRQKLATASPDWSYIHTHFGVGYRFDPERRGNPEDDELPDAPQTDGGEMLELPDEAPRSEPDLVLVA
jgi:hypothetical protein